MNSDPRQRPIYQRPNVGAGNHGTTAPAKPAAPAPKKEPVQDVLLRRWQMAKTEVVVRFVDGSEQRGKVTWVERYSLAVVTEAGLLHANKAQLLWVRPIENPAQ